jgi:hypothetical protein
LVRNSSLSTRFRVPVFRKLNLNVRHNYKFQDQGSYREEGKARLYGKSAERESHVFTVACSYRIGEQLSFLVRQSYFLQQNWKYQEGKKELDYETRSTEITGRAGFEYALGEGSNLSFSVEQNRKEGERVSEAFRKYWNVELEISHVF